MSDQPDIVLRKQSRRWQVPLLVFLASFGLTVFASYYAVRNARLTAKQEFQREVLQAHGAIQARMESYLALLRGGTAFFAGNPDVSRAEFHEYVERLRLHQYYPGVQGFGFSVRLHREDVDKVIAGARSDGLEDFRLWPAVTNEEIHAIAYLEPLDRRNRAALGYNMFNEPVRRDAMQQACDSGAAVASKRVRLVQEIEGRVQAGFLIYAPAYQDRDIPPTVHLRRAELLGFIYSPFRADDLFANVFPGEITNLLELAIYDDGEVNPAALLYRSQPDPSKRGWGFLDDLTTTLPVTIAQHQWTMECSWKGGPAPGWFYAPLVFAAGTIVTVLLVWLTIFEGRARTRAELANEQLRLSDKSLREARGRLEQHAHELEARVAERTASLQQSVSDLEAVLYHVAHDLRAPVRAMGSFATILREDYKERLDSRAIGYLNRIAEAASRMDRLVYDLLTYGRMAQMNLPIEPVSLQKSVSIALSRAEDELRARSVQIDVVGPMPEVNANPGALNDMLSRLLDNAIKFVPPERQPQLKIWASDGAKVRLYLKDNGIGISPEHQERIFQVFEQLQATGSTPSTGIGLAIARKAAERMGGGIGVESIPGRGSKFWIELPAHVTNSAQPAAPDTSKA